MRGSSLTGPIAPVHLLRDSMTARFPPPALLGACAALLMLAGCAAVPDLGPKPAPRPAASVASGRSLAGSGEAWPEDRWWAAYGDAQLTALIEEGLRDAPDVAAADARARRAAGIEQETGAALLPSLDATAGIGTQKQSYNNGFPKEFVPRGWIRTGDLSATMRFDIDLWGRNRAALAAATSDRRAADIDARQARLMLATDIASAYADLARLTALRDIQKQTLDLRIATQTLVADRRASGLETLGSVRQADANVDTARGDLAAADEAIALRRDQIAALAGAGPDRALDIAPPTLGSLAPRALPADVTTDLVARRPDIAMALARTTAAGGRVKMAHADFFPALSISGLIGLQSLGLSHLIEGDSSYGNVGPALSLPLFHGGAISGRYRSARADYDESVASYDRAVIGAYREVADAVTSRAMLKTRLDAARAAVTASEDAYSVAKQRYAGSLSTYLEVLTVEDKLLTARQTLAELDYRAFTLDIALVRALGGGFAHPAFPAAKDHPHG